MLPCGGVSPGQQQEKAGWGCCAGVGVLIGYLGDGMKALWKKKVVHTPKKSVSFFSCTDACLGCCVTLS